MLPSLSFLRFFVIFCLYTSVSFIFLCPFSGATFILVSVRHSEYLPFNFALLCILFLFHFPFFIFSSCNSIFFLPFLSSYVILLSFVYLYFVQNLCPHLSQLVILIKHFHEFCCFLSIFLSFFNVFSHSLFKTSVLKPSRLTSFVYLTISSLQHTFLSCIPFCH